jgi:hydroxypyruvate reductase
MLELPLDPAISFADMAGFHRALIGSGMAIEQMNILRKHVSAVKGGRLAAAASAALRQYTLLLSDVPGGRADLIGSGPSLPDPSTWEDCLSLLARLEKVSEVPRSVLEFFRGGAPVETPKASDDIFRCAAWKILASSADLAESAASLARQAGFEVAIDNGCDDWDYREAGSYLLERAKQLSDAQGACCVISVGEVTVQLPRGAGEGGRNQQFALWCARELDRRKWRATVLSAGSDGIDGNSEAAGAVCDETTAVEALRLGFDVTDSLERFDASPLLRLLRADLVTGPTGNNLRDLRMIFCQGA